MATRDWSWFEENDIFSAAQECYGLLRGPFFDPSRPACVNKAVVISTIMHLNDLLQKACVEGARVAFSDDINPESNAADVTDLIALSRNAACHIGSGNHMVRGLKVGLILAGRVPRAIVIDDLVLGSDYEDELAFIIGQMRVYFRRHIVRAFEEVIRHFSAAYPRHPWHKIPLGA